MGKTQTPLERSKIAGRKYHLKKQIQNGISRGGRPLTPKDIVDLEKEYARLEALVPSGRILGRICSADTNAHTTAEANRVIETVYALMRASQSAAGSLTNPTPGSLFRSNTDLPERCSPGARAVTETNAHTTAEANRVFSASSRVRRAEQS